MRKNEGKPKIGYALLMPEALEALSAVLISGEEKYGPAQNKSWMKYDPDEAIDSLMRHLTALKNGEAHDPESGLPHVHHVLFNSAVLVELTTVGYFSGGSSELKWPVDSIDG